MEKVRYEVDPFNRLVIAGTGKETFLPEFRRVIEGRFGIDDTNDLYYETKTPLREDEDLPHQIKLTGDWSLDKNHNLVLTLDKSGRQTFGDRITLQGRMISAGKDSLLFRLETTIKDNTATTYSLELKGVWKADESNRLSFQAKRRSGRYNTFTLNGAWEIDDDYRITYKYDKSELITKVKETQILTFDGRWNITDRMRISYVLSSNIDSVFTFRTGVSIFRENYIEYELGMEIGGIRMIKTVKLFGNWKMRKDAGLTFEIDCKDGKPYSIRFGAEARLTDKDTVTFSLRSDLENRDLSAKVELSRKILKGDGKIFLRLLESKKELAFYAGAAWRW